VITDGADERGKRHATTVLLPDDEPYGVWLDTCELFPDGRHGIGGFGPEFRSFRCREHAEEEHDDEEEI